MDVNLFWKRFEVYVYVYVSICACAKMAEPISEKLEIKGF